jgi:sugar fermentation stimulation protein A
MIEFSSPLHNGRLVRRYKRFFADVVLDNGTTVIAHCPNTGSMKTCAEEGKRVRLTNNDSPSRKLKYTWELIEGDGGWIGVNTHRVNTVVQAALERQFFPELSAFRVVIPEATWRQGTRFDFVLSEAVGAEPAAFVEVKNVTLLERDSVIFPDCRSTRAVKHARELIEVVLSGKRAILIFVINRPEGTSFRPAWEIDPEYAQALNEARAAGVEIIAVRCRHNDNESYLAERVMIDFGRIAPSSLSEETYA